MIIKHIPKYKSILQELAFTRIKGGSFGWAVFGQLLRSPYDRRTDTTLGKKSHWLPTKMEPATSVCRNIRFDVSLTMDDDDRRI